MSRNPQTTTSDVDHRPWCVAADDRPRDRPHQCEAEDGALTVLHQERDRTANYVEDYADAVVYAKAQADKAEKDMIRAVQQIEALNRAIETLREAAS